MVNMHLSASPSRPEERSRALFVGKPYTAVSSTIGSIFSPNLREGTCLVWELVMMVSRVYNTYVSGGDGEPGRNPFCTHAQTFFCVPSSIMM